MEAAQPQSDRPEGPPNHLRLVLVTDGDTLEVGSTTLVDEVLTAPRYASGGWVYELRRGHDTIWVDVILDPLEDRGLSRPGGQEHSYRKARRGDFVVRVPITRELLEDNFEIRVYRSAAPLPLALADVRSWLAAPDTHGLHLVGTVDRDQLRRGADWPRLEESLGKRE